MLRTCPEFAIYLIYTYATDDVIEKINAALTRYTPHSTMSPTQYAEALLSSFRKCGEVFDKNVLKTLFIDSLNQ